MNFQFDQNTIVLGLVVIFIAWYFYQESKESFKSKKGVQASRGTIKSGKSAPQIVVTPQPPAPAPVVVVAQPPPPPPPPKVVVVSPPSESGDDFAGLL